MYILYLYLCILYHFLALKDPRRLKNVFIKFIILVHSDSTLRNVYAKLEKQFLRSKGKQKVMS